MHENLLARAVVPDRYTVLGLPLMPYSLGCELQLYREDSPFLLLSHAEFAALPLEKQCHALIRAALICCKAPPARSRRWNWWLKGCPVRLWPFKKVVYLGNGADFAFELAEFRNYLDAGRLEFSAELPSGDDMPTRYIGAPELIRLFQHVDKTVSAREIAIWGQSAWDFPLGFARMLHQSSAEASGGLEIYNLKTKITEDYYQQCENGRIAWENAATDEERHAALAKHPIIAELAAIADDFAVWSAKQPNLDEKGMSCPV